MQVKITTLHVDGSTSIWRGDTKPTLEFYQEKVGGNIETVPNFTQYSGQPCIAWCDKEGKLKGKEMNLKATELWVEQLNTTLEELGDVLVGDICIVQGDAAFMRSL